MDTLTVIRNMRLEATKLYNACRFEEFKQLSGIANRIEHEYKLATQEDIG